MTGPRGLHVEADLGKARRPDPGNPIAKNLLFTAVRNGKASSAIWARLLRPALSRVSHAKFRELPERHVGSDQGYGTSRGGAAGKIARGRRAFGPRKSVMARSLLPAVPARSRDVPQ